MLGTPNGGDSRITASAVDVVVVLVFLPLSSPLPVTQQVTSGIGGVVLRVGRPALAVEHADRILAHPDAVGRGARIGGPAEVRFEVVRQHGSAVDQVADPDLERLERRTLPA